MPLTKISSHDSFWGPLTSKYNVTCDVCSQSRKVTTQTWDSEGGESLWSLSGCAFVWIGKYNQIQFVFCNSHPDKEIDLAIKNKYSNQIMED